MAIIDKVRSLNKNVYIIARSTVIGNVEPLYKVGQTMFCLKTGNCDRPSQQDPH